MVADAGAGGLRSPRSRSWARPNSPSVSWPSSIVQLGVAADEPAEPARLRRRREQQEVRARLVGAEHRRRHADRLQGVVDRRQVLVDALGEVVELVRRPVRRATASATSSDVALSSTSASRTRVSGASSAASAARSKRPSSGRSASRSISSSASDTVAQGVGTRAAHVVRRRAGAGRPRGRPRPACAHGSSRWSLAASRYGPGLREPVGGLRRSRRSPAPRRRARRCVSPAARSWRDCAAA